MSDPRFGRPRPGRLGYARSEVDAFLRRLARGVVGVREVETVRFVNRRWRAYAVEGVDAYLDAEAERLREQRPVPRRRSGDRGDGTATHL